MLLFPYPTIYSRCRQHLRNGASARQENLNSAQLHRFQDFYMVTKQMPTFSAHRLGGFGAIASAVHPFRHTRGDNRLSIRHMSSHRKIGGGAQPRGKHCPGVYNQLKNGPAESMMTAYRSAAPAAAVIRLCPRLYLARGKTLVSAFWPIRRNGDSSSHCNPHINDSLGNSSDTMYLTNVKAREASVWSRVPPSAHRAAARVTRNGFQGNCP